RLSRAQKAAQHAVVVDDRGARKVKDKQVDAPRHHCSETTQVAAKFASPRSCMVSHSVRSDGDGANRPPFTATLPASLGCAQMTLTSAPRSTKRASSNSSNGTADCTSIAPSAVLFTEISTPGFGCCTRNQ